MSRLWDRIKEIFKRIWFKGDNMAKGKGGDELLFVLGLLGAIAGGALLVYGMYEVFRTKHKCPSCGIEIKENILQCPNCKVYLKWELSKS